MCVDGYSALADPEGVPWNPPLFAKIPYRPLKWLIGETVPYVQKLPHLLALPTEPPFYTAKESRQGDGLFQLVVQYFTWERKRNVLNRNSKCCIVARILRF